MIQSHHQIDSCWVFEVAFREELDSASSDLAVYVSQKTIKAILKSYISERNDFTTTTHIEILNKLNHSKLLMLTCPALVCTFNLA